MHLLLDTHIFIWWLKDDKSLSKKARMLIQEADEVYISSASIWEAAIKIQLGKLDVMIDVLAASIEKEGFIELPITAKHAMQTLQLSHHHRDPFDRILIAQAISEPLRFLTVDQKLEVYSDLVEMV
ncbi:MAG: type II toxin-antitoxin system VapC family toxin [Gammaproteobacteria bacterium]|nr:MAG: type II toxin-antitoxin system VapC family toxin [Gammaproteobacteria bacterium]